MPGAEQQKQAHLPDLTTAFTTSAGYSIAADRHMLNHPGAVNPSGVPGTQIDGYFADLPPGAPYTSSPFNGWDHDAQFVIRLPDRWNGGLVVAPSPGNRRQYAADFVIGDWVLSRGYAYASTDKGNSGASFYLDGAEPGDAVVEWHRRVRELTVAAKDVARRHYGQLPELVYLFGLSNGGYLVRRALEHDAELYDGGVDWAGTFWSRDGPNLFAYLPAALHWFPLYAAATSTPEQKQAARRAMLAAGFPDGSEALWPLYHQVYWSITQRAYRLVFDPSYSGDEASYEYSGRPAEVKRAVERVSLTGRIERPLITVHGSLDALLPPATNAEPYTYLIARQGCSQLHRYYLVEGGQHTDGYAADFGAVVRPMLPFARAAFVALERWVQHGEQPPTGGTIPSDGDEGLIGRPH